MKQNDNSALKLAIVEGMSAILSAIDKTGDTRLQTTAKPKAEPPKTKVRTKKGKSKSYRVEDLRALYRLADAGLLHCIKGTTQSADYPGTYVYFIEKNPDTKTALAVFLTQEEIAEDV